MTPDDITGPGAPAGFLDAVLSGAALVYFDGRLTEAAVLLAARARELGVPVQCLMLFPGGCTCPLRTHMHWQPLPTHIHISSQPLTYFTYVRC